MSEVGLARVVGNESPDGSGKPSCHLELACSTEAQKTRGTRGSVPKSINSVPRVPTGNGLVVFVGPCDEVRERHEEAGQGDQDGAAADEARPVHPAPEVADEDDQQRVPNLQRDTKPERLRIFLVSGTQTSEMPGEGMTGAWGERLLGGRGEQAGFHLVEGCEQP